MKSLNKKIEKELLVTSVVREPIKNCFTIQYNNNNNNNNNNNSC